MSTAMSATVQAMKHLKIGSTVIATAYKESINQAVKQYYEDGGLKVLAIKGLVPRVSRGRRRGFQARGSGQASRLCLL
jgi:maleate cis-trans isomerase